MIELGMELKERGEILGWIKRERERERSSERKGLVRGANTPSLIFPIKGKTF